MPFKPQTFPTDAAAPWITKVFADTNVLFPFSVMDLMLALTEDGVHEVHAVGDSGDRQGPSDVTMSRAQAARPYRHEFGYSVAQLGEELPWPGRPWIGPWAALEPLEDFQDRCCLFGCESSSSFTVNGGDLVVELQFSSGAHASPEHSSGRKHSRLGWLGSCWVA